MHARLASPQTCMSSLYICCAIATLNPLENGADIAQVPLTSSQRHRGERDRDRRKAGNPEVPQPPETDADRTTDAVQKDILAR